MPPEKDTRDLMLGELVAGQRSQDTKLTEFILESREARKEMSDRLSSLERWRWTLVGAALVVAGVGYEVRAAAHSLVDLMARDKYGRTATPLVRVAPAGSGTP